MTKKEIAKICNVDERTIEINSKKVGIKLGDRWHPHNFTEDELKKEQEDDRLFWAVMNVEEECPLIYQEFGLDPQSALNCLQFLDTAFREQSWIEVIDWATTLAQNVRFDLLENRIHINTMNTLMSNLLELIEIADRKLLRDWEIKRD